MQKLINCKVGILNVKKYIKRKPRLHRERKDIKIETVIYIETIHIFVKNHPDHIKITSRLHQDYIKITSKNEQH